MSSEFTLEHHIQWQRDRAFTAYSEEADLNSFKKKFEEIPNESCHLLDCQTLDIHLVRDNFAEVLGIPDLKTNSIFDLFGLVHEDHHQMMMDFIGVHLANESVMECGKDSVSQVYKIANGNMILKTSTPLQMDSNKHVILVAEQYRNVTNLVSSTYKWSYSGPNAKQIEILAKNALKKNNPLTPQELTVLSYLSKGDSSKITADKLFLSKFTIDTHRRNILKKLKVSNTAEALNKAINMGVLA